MAKLILSLDNANLGEFLLDKDRITIGRRPSNDIHIDNLAVSGEHAAVLKMGNDYFIEDLDSTNGTVINTKPAKKHFLQHGDLIELGKYQLKYVNEETIHQTDNANTSTDFEKTMIIRPATTKAYIPQSATATTSPAQLIVPPVPVSTSAPTQTPVTVDFAKIQVLNGSNAGRELVLNKALVTLGKTGVQVAVITKRSNGYFITHVEGKVQPIVNGTAIGAQAFSLKNHDVIEIAGVKMEFYLGN